jgi:glycosyltransferase involved in cell wall biosynthesis
LKLVILDSWFHWPPKGGAIRAVKEVADGLAKRGVDVTLVVPRMGYRGAVDPKSDFLFDVKKINFFHFDGPNFYLKSKEVINQIRPDVVLVANGNLLKPYMIKACLGYPTLVRLYAYEFLCPASHGVLYRQGHVCEFDYIHNPWTCLICPENIHRIRNNTTGIEIGEFLRSYSFFVPGFHHLMKECISQATKFIVTSRFMEKRFGVAVPQEKMTVIPDGVNTEIFTPKQLVVEGPRRISFLGRADPLKGVNTILQACSILWKKRQDFRLTVTSTTSIPSTYPFILENGWRSEEELPLLYQSNYLVTVPSLWNEPFGLTALEAMSCGVPVVASRAGGLAELIKDGETGLLCPPGDSSKLASEIEILLSDEDFAHRLGSQARDRVLRNFSWPLIIKKYLSLLDETVSTKTNS